MNAALEATVQKFAITDRVSWLAWRMQDVTASDVGAVLGVDPRRTPMRVHAEKMGMVADNDDGMMQRGRWLEPAIFEALADERPDWKVRRAGVYLRAPDLRLGATPDGVAIDPGRDGFGNVQGKVVAEPEFEEHWRDGGEVTAPLHYTLQTLTEAKLMGAQWAAIAALVVGAYTAKLFVVDVPRHAEAERKIVNAVGAFWRRFDAGEWPGISAASDRAVMLDRFPKDDGLATWALREDPEVQVILAERHRLKAEIKLRSDHVASLEARIMERMGAAAMAPLRRGRISFKRETRLEHWVPESTSRVLRISWKPEDHDDE